MANRPSHRRDIHSRGQPAALSSAEHSWRTIGNPVQSRLRRADPVCLLLGRLWGHCAGPLRGLLGRSSRVRNSAQGPSGFRGHTHRSGLHRQHDGRASHQPGPEPGKVHGHWTKGPGNNASGAHFIRHADLTSDRPVGRGRPPGWLRRRGLDEQPVQRHCSSRAVRRPCRSRRPVSRLLRGPDLQQANRQGLAHGHVLSVGRPCPVETPSPED